jgi:hypothetical protein
MKSFEKSVGTQTVSRAARGRRVGGLGLLGANLSLAAACASGVAPNQGGTPNSAPPAVPVGKVALDKSNFCAWSIVNPEPLVSANPPIVQVDGRCNRPVPTHNPWDPANDTPIGIDKQPIFGSGHIDVAPDGVKDGTPLVVDACVTSTGEGGTIMDAQTRTSDVWFVVHLGGELGYIPQVNAGWAQPYLHALNVPGC